MTDLNAQAQAEQPAEPVAVVFTDIDGGNKRVCFYSNKAFYETPVWAKLYAHPDPRTAVLEGLLREAHETLSSGLESDSELEHAWSKADRELCERIAAALKGE